MTGIAWFRVSSHPLRKIEARITGAGGAGIALDQSAVQEATSNFERTVLRGA